MRSLPLSVVFLALVLTFGTVTFWSERGSAAVPLPEPWLMFHGDATHSGYSPGKSNISATDGPRLRWEYRIAPTPDDPVYFRWAASFPVGDLNGDGLMEVVVTTPVVFGGDLPARVIALKETTTTPRTASPLWTYTLPGPPGEVNVDQYSAALVDADGDGLLDVVFSDSKGTVRAVKGTNGTLLWQFATGRTVESGPTVADLDGDGKREVMVVTDCPLPPAEYNPLNCPTGLYVFSARSTTGATNQPLWTQTFSFKLDSSVPAVADIDPSDGTSRKAIILGTWGAQLVVLWRQPDGTIVKRDFPIRSLDPSVNDTTAAVIRSAPMVTDFGDGPVVVFGWMPDDLDATKGRVSAVGVRANMQSGTVTFTPKWTVNRADWKSSVALLPVGSGPPMVVTGYGNGIPGGGGSGATGTCQSGAVFGGVVAIRADGTIAWEKEIGPTEGNVRGSAVVADLDGNGVPEVILPVGCYGKLHVYNGATGAEEWSRQLGARTQSTPSLADLDGDGNLEVVIGSYDGYVRVFEGGSATATPVPHEPLHHRVMMLMVSRD